MACSKPVPQEQFPVLCQLCEVEPKIKWKCVECDLLLCTKCKDKIHSKVKTAEEHKIINIKEVGAESDQDNVQSAKTGPVGKSSDQDTVHLINKGPVNLELAIVQEYSTNFEVDYIQASLDDSLWIGSIGGKKKTFFRFKSSRNLQKVKPERDNLKVVSSFNVMVSDIAITLSNDLILADNTPNLKQILHNSNKVTESNYCVKPYNAYSVHVIRDSKVVIGAFLQEEEGAVYVMDMNGVRLKIYRHDDNNKPFLIWPFRITSTSKGTLCVIDLLRDPYKGRLVMLGQEEAISVYTGHPNINSDKAQFRPDGVVSTSNDNIIVTDYFTCTLHILNNTGSFLTYCDTRKIGEQLNNPISLAFNMAGKFSILYLGCSSGDENEGKLYKLTLSGY